MTEQLPYHVQLRRAYQWELFLAFLVPILGILLLVAGSFLGFPCLLLAPVGPGLWRAEEWARRWFGGVAVVLACVLLGRLLLHFTDVAEVSKTLYQVVGVLVWSGIAYHLLDPSAGKAFAAARESIARARAVPR